MGIARMVTGARMGTSHDLILNELNWPSLADRREGAKLKNFIKIINKLSAVNLWNSLKGSDRTLTYADSLLKKLDHLCCTMVPELTTINMLS